MAHFSVGNGSRNFFFGKIAVQPNGTTLTGSIALSFLVFPHLIAGAPGEVIGGTLFFHLAIKNIPTGGQY